MPKALMWGIDNPVVWQHQGERVLFLSPPVPVEDVNLTGMAY